MSRRFLSLAATLPHHPLAVPVQLMVGIAFMITGIGGLVAHRWITMLERTMQWPPYKYGEASHYLMVTTIVIGALFVAFAHADAHGHVSEE